METTLVSGEVVARAHAALPNLGSTDRRVIEVILANPEAVIRASATELAQQAGTAQSSAVRACQRLGYRGFQDLKLAIVRDLARQDSRAHDLAHEGINAETPPDELVARIFQRSSQALADAQQTVDAAKLALAIEGIRTASRVLVIGNGTSVPPAQDAGYRLSVLGLVASAPSDVMAQHLAASHLDPSCAALIISHTGATRETLLGAEAARDAGAFTVAITSYTSSPLTRIVGTAIVAGGPDYGFRLEAMASRLAHLAVIDALFVGIAVRQPTRSTAALDLMADITVQHSI